MSDKQENQWSWPFGVWTKRVDTRVPAQASGYAKVWDYSSPEVEVEDRSKRSESDAMADIWKSYAEGY